LAINTVPSGQPWLPPCVDDVVCTMPASTSNAPSVMITGPVRIQRTHRDVLRFSLLMSTLLCAHAHEPVDGVHRQVSGDPAG
jgi:hypothetical protein